MIQKNKINRNILLLWSIFSGIIFTLLFIQTIAGKYGDSSKNVWGWVINAIIPSFTIIISYYFSDKKKDEKLVSKTLYRISLIISLFYLLSILIILLIETEVERMLFSIIDDLNLYIGVVQSLIAVSVIKLFK